MKAIIIDDEPLARDLIKSYLNEHPDVEIAEECSDGFQGVKAVHQHSPDLLFLDVQMPKLTGFEMLEVLDNIPFVVFTTAYDQFAIQAFEKNAVDYLLKPFSKERFSLALNKVRERMNDVEHESGKVKKMLETMPQDEKTDRVVVKTGSKVKVIPIGEIIYLEAQDDYVMLYTQEGKYLKQQTMKFYEDQLDAKQFVRVHRSYIINIDYIAQIEPYEKDSYRIALKNKAVVPVSRSGYKRLKERFNF